MRRIRKSVGRRATDGFNACLKLVQFPAYAMDMLDRTGKPDHGKIVPFIVVQELIVLLCLGRLPVTASAVALVSVLITAVFGQSMWRAHLKAKHSTGETP